MNATERLSWEACTAANKWIDEAKVLLKRGGEKERELDVLTARVKAAQNSVVEASLLFPNVGSYIAQLEKERGVLRAIVRDFIDNTEVPAPNCACHLAPPCSDCVEYGALRELIANAETAIKDSP